MSFVEPRTCILPAARSVVFGWMPGVRHETCTFPDVRRVGLLDGCPVSNHEPAYFQPCAA
eukprot:7115072-Karenia_brevis.AAC.2